MVFSGGQKATGWKNHIGGIKKTKINYDGMITELYVGDKPAVLARTNTQIFPESWGSIVATGSKPGSSSVKIKVSNKDVPVIASGNMYYSTIQKWMFTAIPAAAVEYLDENYNNIVVDNFDINSASAAISGTVMNENAGFYLENALELLDEPGEFFYDNASKYLFYYPREGEDLSSTDVIYPVSEGLLEIRGRNVDEKVKNIEFDGITFANSKWDRIHRMPYIPFQGAAIKINEADEKDYKTDPNLVPSAVSLYMADGISFKNCVIKNTGGCGIGLYDGVENSELIGNVIADTAHSGIIVGTPSYAFEEKGRTNLAYLKPVTASGCWETWPETGITDDNPSTSWHSWAYDTNSHFIVDLGAAYEVDGLELTMSRTEEDFHRNFAIYGAEIKDGSWTLLAQQGSDAFTGTWSAEVSDTAKYRYIKFEKGLVNNGYSANPAMVTDFKVFSDTAPGNKEIAKNNIVKNNYITRVGHRYPDAVGVQIFYTEGIKLSHNEIKNVPYTGVSIGWGWTLDATDGNVFASKNNEMTYNLVEDYMQRAFDGGGVYTLGYQPGLKINGNYFKNGRYNYGAIYPDEGTRGTSANPIEVSGNVIENTTWWFHNWISTAKTMNVTGNYTNVTAYKHASPDIIISGTIQTAGNAYAGVAGEIVQNAGMEDEYQNIKAKVSANDNDNSYTYEEHMKYGSTLSKNTTYSKSGAKSEMSVLLTTAEFINECVAEGKIAANENIAEMNNVLAETEMLWADSADDVITLQEYLTAWGRLRDAVIKAQDGVYGEKVIN